MTIDQDVFEKIFKPLRDENEDIEYCEYDKVKNYSVEQVWTRVSGDNNELIISPGFRIVNKLDYIICNVPRTENWHNDLEVMQYDHYSLEQVVGLCEDFIAEYLDEIKTWNLEDLENGNYREKIENFLFL